jgi:hypothetical protein
MTKIAGEISCQARWVRKPINPLNAKGIYLLRACPIYPAEIVILELESENTRNAKIELFRV